MIEVRRADCGHWISSDIEPVAITGGAGHSPQPVFLCDECFERARLAGPRLETKTIAHAPIVEDAHVEAGPEGLRLAPDPGLNAPHYESGRRAALDNRPRTLPDDLRGDHSRSARPRAWFAGYDSAKEPT